MQILQQSSVVGHNKRPHRCLLTDASPDLQAAENI